MEQFAQFTIPALAAMLFALVVCVIYLTARDHGRENKERDHREGLNHPFTNHTSPIEYGP